MYGAGDENLGTQIGCTPEEVAEFKKQDEEWRKTKKILIKKGKPGDPTPPDYRIACTMKGAQLRAKFLANVPALDKLISGVKGKAKSQGFLTLQDGRRVPVRSQHAALNCLLQGAGAVTCKRWVVRFSRRLREEFGPAGWDGLWSPLGFIHDEVQLAVRPHIVDRVKQILVEEIRAVGVEFNLRVPLDGAAQHGPNWAACH